MKRTLEEEKMKILSMINRLNENIELSYIGGLGNMAVNYIKDIREKASGMSDDEFKEFIMRAVDTILSGEGNELENPIDSNVNDIEGESSDDTDLNRLNNNVRKDPRGFGYGFARLD